MKNRIKTDLNRFNERQDEIGSTADSKYIKETINILKSELRQNKDLTCLCAPQIGKNYRLFVVKTADKTYKEFLNPMIITSSKERHLSMEQNPSFPNKTFICWRHDNLHLAYQKENGEVSSETYKGPYAEVIQQMVQMLDGVLLSDIALDLDDVGGLEAWNSASQDEKIEVMQMFSEHLKLESKSLNKEIKENPELKLIDDNINFQTQYLKGEITLLDKEGNPINKKEVVK